MRARRRFGQHFLEPVWAAKVLAAIAPDPQDTFLEIGPGRGALTGQLASRARQLVAVEIDRDLAASLTKRLPANVRIVTGDVLEVDLSGALPPDAGRVRVAGNLPYNVSSPILRRLFALHEADGRVTDATLMLQREVADRIAARPGTREYGVLTVAAARHARVERLLELPPGAFRPVPKVHSALVRLVFRRDDEVMAIPERLDALVRAVFAQRRKRLSNALRPFADATGVPAADALARAGIDPARRPETVSLEEFIRLAAALDPVRPDLGP